MSEQNKPLTPAQGLQILTELAAHRDLRLNLAEHSAVQQALQSLRPLVEAQQQPVGALVAASGPTRD